jgi:hypothetical protein
MAVIQTGTHPRALWPGVAAWFGLKYDEHPKEYTDLFDIKKSRKNYEIDVQSVGFGLAPQKAEGTPLYFDETSQGYEYKYAHLAYALGYIVTKEELDDNLYEEVSMRRSEALAFAMNQTKETVAANTYNRAFSNSYTFGDGKELLATDHPLSGGGTFSNELSPAADLSEAALEDMVTQIHGAVNDRSLKIVLHPRSVIVPRQLFFEANRILKSTLQNDTANNAINVLKATNAIPEGIKLNHYLTDEDAWFIRTNAPRGLIMWDRNPIEFDKDNDFDTKNAKASAYFRFSVGASDPRGLYGSEGS